MDGFTYNHIKKKHNFIIDERIAEESPIYRLWYRRQGVALLLVQPATRA
jgi:hypothetical protein